MTYNHIRNNFRRSISFSIAYVRVCEWSREPWFYSRPGLEVLDNAEIHAKYINDQHICNKIQECRVFYQKVKNTPTPLMPVPTYEADRISTAINIRPSRPITVPYSLEFLTEDEKLDRELDLILK